MIAAIASPAMPFHSGGAPRAWTAIHTATTRKQSAKNGGELVKFDAP